MRITEVTETTRDTRKRLEAKSDIELAEFLMDVDHSIRAGFEHAIYFQEWSVGTDILKRRGYEIYQTSDVAEILSSLQEA